MRIEDQEKKEEEKKRGAVLPWGGQSAAGGLAPGGSGVIGAGKAAAGLAALSTSHKVGAVVMGLLLAGSTAGLLYINLAMPNPKGKRVKRFLPSKVQSAGGMTAEGGRVGAAPGSASLDYLASANQGALGAGKTTDSPASASAEPGKEEGAASSDAPAGAGGSASADAAAGQAAVGGGMGQKIANVFGKLTSGFGGGGGLRGGAGLSGGIGRGFDQPGGAGKAPKGAAAGQLQAMSRQLTPTRTKVPVARQVASARRGANLRRLDNMNRAIRPTAATGSLQNASQTGTDQWSSGQAQGGAGSGAGAGAGVRPAGSDSLGGPDDGGPIGVGPGTPTTPITPTTPDVPDTGGSQDVTPWGGMVMMAQMLLMIASVIIIIMGFVKDASNGPWKAVLEGIALMLYMAATAMAAIAAVLGIMIATSYGQVGQGAVIGLAGTLMTAAALYGYTSGSMGAISANWVVILGGLIGLAGSVIAPMMK